jgi:hypothetical protein
MWRNEKPNQGEREIKKVKIHCSNIIEACSYLAYVTGLPTPPNFVLQNAFHSTLQTGDETALTDRL